jgi:polyvinyl alcohol dehydrogenase (cytochrome)
MRNRIFLLLSLATVFARDAASLYKQNCASCHDGSMDRAPSRDALHAMSAERVRAAVETGPMIFMAGRRTAAERCILAEL